MQNELNNLKKENHGVFIGDPVSVTNFAWINKGDIKPVLQSGVDVYVIPYERAGISGGYAGQGSILNNVTIITKRGTNKIITAFPSGAGLPVKY